MFFANITFVLRVEPVQVGLPSLRRTAAEHVDALANDHRAVEGSRGGNVAVRLDLAPRLGVRVKHPEVVEQFLVDRGAHPPAEHEYALAHCSLGVSEPDGAWSFQIRMYYVG